MSRFGYFCRVLATNIFTKVAKYLELFEKHYFKASFWTAFRENYASFFRNMVVTLLVVHTTRRVKINADIIWFLILGTTTWRLAPTKSSRANRVTQTKVNSPRQPCSGLKATQVRAENRSRLRTPPSTSRSSRLTEKRWSETSILIAQRLVQWSILLTSMSVILDSGIVLTSKLHILTTLET